MIRYDLVCDHGDRFEAWFRNSDDFEHQAAAGVLVCPACGSPDVVKALMAPAVRRRTAKAHPAPAIAEAPPNRKPSSMPVSSDPKLAEAVATLREVAREIRANAEDVGRRFPEEARRIHYAESEPRSIVGQATPQEAKALAEEGIEAFPLPVLPEDLN